MKCIHTSWHCVFFKSILLDSNEKKCREFLDCAKELLWYLAEHAHEFYGDTLNVYNVHDLCHIHDDVRYYNTFLNDINAFLFENHLQTTKKLVKKSENPITQEK